MQCYWAEIQLGTDRRIVFHTESDLAQKELLDMVEALRADFKKHQKSVSLTIGDVEKLKQAGVTVLKQNFLALQATWHWFTGSMNMDAFSLSPEFKSALVRVGCIKVSL